MLAQKLVLPVKSSMNCDAERRKRSIALAEVWGRGSGDLKMIEEQIVAGPKENGAGGSLENIPRNIFSYE